MRHKTGVIQVSFLPGLLLLTLVIAAVSMLVKRQPDSAFDTEDAMQAMAILVQGASYQNALARALADGAIAPYTSGILDLAATLTAAGIMSNDTIPRPPTESLTQATQWTYAQHYFRAMDARAPAFDLGTGSKDHVLYLPYLTPNICAHINNRLFGTKVQLTEQGRYLVAGKLDEVDQLLAVAHGTSPAGAQAPAREGCVNYGDASYTYYKVIGVN